MSAVRSAPAQRRNRLQISPQNNVLAVRDAALEAAGAIRRTIEPLARRIVPDFVLHFGAVASGIRHARADFHRLYGLDRHNRLRQLRVELLIPLRVRAEAGRKPANDYFENPPTESPARKT